MSDQIHLRIGARPWLPADTATMIKELDRWDRPTAGILEQHGCFFLFECIEGHVIHANLWVYAPVSLDEVERLGKLSEESLTRLMDEILNDRDLTAALAVESHITAGADVAADQVKSLGLAHAALDAIEEGMRRNHSATQTLHTAGV